jgi:hypothetical protein
MTSKKPEKAKDEKPSDAHAVPTPEEVEAQAVQARDYAENGRK